MSALSTRLTLLPYGVTASTARRTTSMQASQSPSTVVNIASVRFGRPEARTTATAAATASETEPSAADGLPEGATEKATSTLRGYPAPPTHPPGRPPRPRRHRRLMPPRTPPTRTSHSRTARPGGARHGTPREGRMSPRRLRVAPAARPAVRLASAVLAAAVLVALLEAAVLDATVLRPAGATTGERWSAVRVLAGGAVLAAPLALLFGGWELARRHTRALRELEFDDLTGIGSRRAFGAVLPDAVRAASDAGRPLTLALVELAGVPASVDLLGRRRTEVLVAAAAATLA